MAGLVPAIHAAPFPANPKLFRWLEDVDDRDEPGHDDVGFLILAAYAPREEGEGGPINRILFHFVIFQCFVARKIFASACDGAISAPSTGVAQ